MTAGLEWLVGFIDGEGSFTLIADKKRFIKAAFQVSNTVRANIDVVKTEVSRLVGREVRYRVDAGYKPTHRPHYTLYLSRHSEIRALCEAILPHIVGKREQVELMLRYLEMAPRVTRVPVASRLGTTGFTEEHWRCVKLMSDLNWGRSQQETEQVAPPTAVEETVRTPA